MLAVLWAEECKHIAQMIGSGYDLNYEELLCLLTSLSELTFVKQCLASLGVNSANLAEVPSAVELRAFLRSQGRVYPRRWSLPHTMVLESEMHWWWRKPGRTLE
jgi:hypothetical protein